MKMLDARSNQRPGLDSTYVTCQAPRKDGTPCSNEPDLRNPWGICHTHWRALAESYRPLEEERRRVRCVDCGLATAFVRSTGVAFCVNPSCGASFDAMKLPVNWPTTTKPSPVVEVVYYMRFSDRIKIGTTTNLVSRSQAIYNDEVIAIERGGYALEHERHEQFKGMLVPGQREWFFSHPLLDKHMAILRRENGEPFKASAAWYAAMRRKESA